MSRSIFNRRAQALFLLSASSLFHFPKSAAAGVVVSIVPGSLTQGAVKASLTGGSYASESANMNDWPLNTGGSASNTFAISFENSDFNGNSFGGNTNTMIAFGNGGGVTFQLSIPIDPTAGQKDLGIFTAQAITGGSGTLFNSNMEAAILVSSDDISWYTLTGQLVSSSFNGGASQLNAPTMAYNYLTGAAAWKDGAGTSAANLAALSVANFKTPMPNDNLFNGTGTNAQRLALTTDTSTADYSAIFGASGGGNWFDVSQSGLSQIAYVRLNGDANDPASGGVRLDAVFVNQDAVVVPLPPAAWSSLTVLCGLAIVAVSRRAPRGSRQS